MAAEQIEKELFMILLVCIVYCTYTVGLTDTMMDKALQVYGVYSISLNGI